MPELIYQSGFGNEFATEAQPSEGTEGSLLEKTRRGTAPLRLPSGEVRSFLEEDDEVILRGFCEREGLPRIGFGDCKGRVTHALA